MKPKYRLYYSPGACSLAAHIVIEELGLLYEPVKVTIAEGLNRKPEYLAINPRGRVPALELVSESGHQVLTEVMAILLYLADRHPNPQLMPEGREAFFRLIEWMSWLTATMHASGVRTVFRPERFTTDPTGAPGIAEQGRIAIRAGYEDIEQRLKGKTWAFGEQYTVLDPLLLVYYRWGNRCGTDMRKAYPSYAAMMDRVRARPVVAKVVADEAIQID
jgi:glutathione S-transferase